MSLLNKSDTSGWTSANLRKYQIFKNNYNWVIGVSKNFNPEVCVDINGKPNPGFIADLPVYHRTPVACFKNPDFFGDMEWTNSRLNFSGTICLCSRRQHPTPICPAMTG